MGNDPELLQIISILLGSNKENVVEGNFIPMTVVHDVLNLTKETAYSHLMEVRNLLMGCASMLGNSIFRCFPVRLPSPTPFPPLFCFPFVVVIVVVLRGQVLTLQLVDVYR